MSSYRLLAFFLCLFVAIALFKKIKQRFFSKITPDKTRDGLSGNKYVEKHQHDAVLSYPPVEPCEDFDWLTTEPLKIRAFKPTYHLTLGITNVDVSSLIQMDKNYLTRIKIRREIMESHKAVVLAANDKVKPAVDEFYTWLLGTYLPTRYPRMFTLCRKAQDGQRLSAPEPFSLSKENLGLDHGSLKATHLENHATQEIYALEPPTTPLETLRAIGGIIEDDCQFLLPAEDGDGYTLQGLVTCFPNGFNMAQKLGLKLRDIHGPVPHYKEKIEKSMDRFFSRLEVGKFVKRVNWSVAATPDLFNPRGNHIYDDDQIPDDSSVDPSKAVLRSELQILHKLPRTKAILFTFKTFTYPLQEIKDEGLGNELAAAIDGMRNGSAPKMYTYKGAVVWGEKTKEFLNN